MVNATDTYWEADGVSLATMAWRIETLEGTMDPPKLKGGDIDLPHRLGEVWVPKVAGSRTVSLAMWVIGTDEDGATPKARDQLFIDNWRKLFRAFYKAGRQIQLRKRFYHNGAIRSATALAEYQGGLEPSMMGRYGAKAVVTLKLADPYFYDDVVTQTPLAASTSVTVLGDAETTRVKLIMNGARNLPKVRNNTRGIEATYNAQLLTGERVELDVGAFTALFFPSGGGASQRVGGRIVHAGAPHWIDLQPGVNVMQASSSSGTGAIVMEHQGAWL